MTAPAESVAPHDAVFRMTTGVFVSGALGCLARLGIPDLLEAGPKTPDELARETGANRDALHRLMRATACLGVLAEDAAGAFSQTPLSDVLRTNATPSLRAWAIMTTQEWHLRGWGELEYCVRTGKQALEHLYGKPTFDWLFEDAGRTENFNQAMTALSTIDSPAVADVCPLDGVASIMDVAGGHGLLLATILARHPRMKGTLFEAPQVVEGARTGPLEPMLDRCSFASGDMFTSLPAGVDAYIMKHIIHDWPDEGCIRILKNCRAGVNTGGRLLVVDDVIHPGNAFEPGKFLDLEMLIFPGGHERTEQQFKELFAASGWRLTRVIPTATPISIVEGVPA